MPPRWSCRRLGSCDRPSLPGPSASIPPCHRAFRRERQQPSCLFPCSASWPLIPSLSNQFSLRFFVASRWFDVPLFRALDVDVRLQGASSDLSVVLRVQILELRSRLPRPALLGPGSGARAGSASALLARHTSSFSFF